MSLKHGILGLLTYKSMTGYELMKIFNVSLSFFWSAQTSQIYRELEALKKNGWVDSECVVQTDKPNKNIFTLTDLGKIEFVRWLDEHSIENVSKIRDSLTMRVFFGSEGDPKLLMKELIDYKMKNEAFLSGLSVLRNEFNTRAAYINKEGEQIYWHMAVSRGHSLAEANVKWADECVEIVQELINNVPKHSE